LHNSSTVPKPVTNLSRLRVDASTGQIGYAWNTSLFYVKGDAAVANQRWDLFDTVTGVGLASTDPTSRKRSIDRRIAFRPEASLIYVNADAVPEAVFSRLREAYPSVIRLAICDLSASPYMDLAGSRMLRALHAELATRGISLRIIGARGSVRDLLRAEGIEDKVGRLDRTVTLDGLLAANLEVQPASASVPGATTSPGP
jgi:MFS superfamily sulfate permease-like transporter